MTSKQAPAVTNPVTVNLPDSWENRMQSASIFLGIEPRQVEHLLKEELGVEQEPAGMEMLSDENITPFGDIRKVFGDDLGVPLAKLRMAMKYLRGPKDSKKTDTVNPEMIMLKEKYGIKPSLKNIPTEQLLEDYKPDHTDHPVTRALKSRFKDSEVIVFKPDSTEVDIEATANYIADLEQGFPTEDMIESQGEMVRPLKVGQIPEKVVDEDPLFAGTPLKRGRSIVNRVNWSGIDIAIKQFVRLAVEMGEIDPDDKRDVKDTIKLANGATSLRAFKEEYPEVALEYREQSKLNKLPSLVMTMQEAQSARKQNPFGIGNNRSF